MDSRNTTNGNQEYVGAAEALARRLYDTEERLAPSFGYTTRTEPVVSFGDLPANRRNLLIAVCYQIQHRDGADPILLGAVETEVRDAWEAVRQCHAECDGDEMPDTCGKQEDRLDAAVRELIALLAHESHG